MSGFGDVSEKRTLRSFADGEGTELLHTDVSPRINVSILEDLAAKDREIARIANKSFVADSTETDFVSAQEWISHCAGQIDLPPNFCAGLLIVRLCRLMVGQDLQSEVWVSSVIRAAASYDFSFLALALADDESDLHQNSKGQLKRHLSHPNTRAVDAINLALLGLASQEEILSEWPVASPGKPQVAPHMFRYELLSEQQRALREASFPILFDRAGLGHEKPTTGSELRFSPLLIDENSFSRVQSYSRHRAHSYFQRALRFSSLLCGFAEIEKKLEEMLSELFRLLGLLGSAADDIDDLFLDFEAGIHSSVSVVAHMSVSPIESVRPASRRRVDPKLIDAQRFRLNSLFGRSLTGRERNELLELLDEMGLKESLRTQYKGIATEFSQKVYEVVVDYGFSTEIIRDLVVVVAKDPVFDLPPNIGKLMTEIDNPFLLQAVHSQVGEFITDYFVDRFWPQLE